MPWPLCWCHFQPAARRGRVRDDNSRRQASAGPGNGSAAAASIPRAAGGAAGSERGQRAQFTRVCSSSLPAGGQGRTSKHSKHWSWRMQISGTDYKSSLICPANKVWWHGWSRVHGARRNQRLGRRRQERTLLAKDCPAQRRKKMLFVSNKRESKGEGGGGREIKKT